MARRAFRPRAPRAAPAGQPRASAALRRTGQLRRRSQRDGRRMTTPALETTSVRIDGQRIRYALGGAPEASRTLLLFNGIGASIETMTHFMASFQHTRVLAFDVPGVGGSPAPLLPYRLRDIVR